MLNNAALLMAGNNAGNVAQIACSDNTTWFLTKSGELYGCGDGYYGQQGNGSTSNVITFTKRADNVAQVACSNDTTWYVTNSGELYGCGDGENGQQGIDTGWRDTCVMNFTKRADNVAQVACSMETSWYITKSGELYGCGEGGYGQQGNGSTARVKAFTKRADNVAQVACVINGVAVYDNSSWEAKYINATWYVTKSGELYGCGFGSAGQQGNGSADNVTTFTKRSDNAAQIVCSSYTTWYVTKSGELYGCGFGSAGQQGNGSTNNVTRFTKRF